MANKKSKPAADRKPVDRKPTITVSEELHERCKAVAALHGEEMTVFVERWIEETTKEFKPIHDRIRRQRGKK